MISKSDEANFFQFKIRRDGKFLFQNLTRRRNLIQNLMQCERFYSKSDSSNCLLRASIRMPNAKKDYEEFITFVCLIIGGFYLIVGFFNDVVLMMAVMALLLRLPPHIFESFWIAKYGDV